MGYLLLADFVVIVHLLFVAFAVGGGILVLKDRRWAWAHIPAVAWAALVELTGWTCPLTPLENLFRTLGGTPPYASDFIQRYVLPLLYPTTLSRSDQILLGLFVISLNAGIYAWIFRHWQR